MDKNAIHCYVFDIDGTIADLSHRLHHIQVGAADTFGGPRRPNWDAFFADCHKDAPIPHVIGLAQALATHETVIYVSGRSDQCRADTEAWLGRYGLPNGRLYMRKAGDHRPDYLVKGELLDRLIADGFKPLMAFDDRDQVVKMWRERGIPCAQVADGNF